MTIFRHISCSGNIRMSLINFFCVLLLPSRCWTALWTWWKRHGGPWACSDDARSQIARSSTTGDGVRVNRKTHAKEAQAQLPSPRHTAPTLQSRVGTAIYNSIMLVCSGNQSFYCHFFDWCLLFSTRTLLHDPRGGSQTNANQIVVTV